jgi:hypothetical protein
MVPNGDVLDMLILYRRLRLLGGSRVVGLIVGFAWCPPNLPMASGIPFNLFASEYCTELYCPLQLYSFLETLLS